MRPDGGPARPGVAPPIGPAPGRPTGVTGEHGEPSPTGARAATPILRPDDRLAGRAAPPHRTPEPADVPPGPPPPRAGENPAVARAAVASVDPVGQRPGAEPPLPGSTEPEHPDSDRPEDDPSDVGQESRRQAGGEQRMRAIILAVVSVVLLGGLPAFFGVQAMRQDPVFVSLNELDVPDWAAVEPVDDVSGSRWCLLDCRLRERTVNSERSPEETAQVYEAALSRDGWQRWTPDYCPEQEEKGSYTCWRRDELTLDLWVRAPACVPPPVDGEPAVVPEPDPSTAAEECAGSLVSVKVRNAIDDERTRPQPTTDPSLTGVDPYPTLGEDPLGELTPSTPS
ncbi:hypothetical protein Vqi01_23290 [Micromonospora qiuiae]|uniref:Collagen-like protein n=2 Tax=Micromonospora qiuiae TaxID=502268 RepID=A0ABQ4JAQ6_9ACTN|nr:hypothetical protein Vqi01_23290 [Micromonospora qiuiae]